MFNWMCLPTRVTVAAIVAGGLLGLAASASASLSDNLLAGPAGDFEDNSALKLADSPLTEGEVNPVKAWQFHPDFDIGTWVANYGSSAVDDPRATWNSGGTSAPTNLSVDPLNPGNHVLEGARFRPTTGIIVPAPEHHVAGTASIDFDYYWNNWTGQPPGASGTDGASIFKMWIYGFNEADLPTWGDRWGPTNNGPANEGAVFDGFLWTNPNWNEWGWGSGNPSSPAPGQDEPQVLSLGDQWNTFSTTDPDRATFEITETYDYYYMSLYLVTYSDTHLYFFLYGDRPADSMAVAIDNIDLRVSIQLPGDFDGSGTVDTQDINPFILALTDWAGYMAAYPDVDPIEVDPNGSGTVNTEDINPFIALLTGGGQASIIPEPASLSLLALGGLAMLRRRR